jgi:hypothetical protein
MHRGRLRYTRCRRRGGRVVREYVGRGPAAELVAQADALARAARRKEVEARRVERANWDTARAPLQELVVVTDLLVAAALLAAGYHQHDRGAWRRRQHNGEDTSVGTNCG